VRDRTRSAIIDAAVTTWVHDRDATLADIARQAQTHRATLHRHFPSRAELRDAAVSHCVEALVAATTAAAVHDGTPAEALRRLIANYLAAGHHIRFLFEDVSLASHPAVAELASSDGPVTELIRRGQETGDFDDRLQPAWIERAVWALVYAASEAVDDGTLVGHRALDAVVRTVEHGITS
jgi:AcrR family transcriptional regulator